MERAFRQLLLLPILIQALLLCGCAATAPPPSVPPALFADASFAPPSQAIGTDGLFALSPAMRTYLRSAAFARHLRNRDPKQGLLDALYSKSDLLLEYDARVTRTAAETYAARSGNCLSLVIMTAAFARELGMVVRYQGIQTTDETWTRENGLYVLSTHVNIALGNRNTTNGADPDTMLVVDFLSPPEASRLHAYPLAQRDIEALYLNNRAVETLMGGNVDDAYWWARAAIMAAPGDATAYNTLGVIYQRHGDALLAERALRAALARAPENLPVLQNLGPLLASLGRDAEARAIARRLALLQPVPPFHDFNLGMDALERGDYAAARDLFAREVRRAPYSDEFHFWLAMAYLRLGETRKAQAELALAVQHSVRGDTRERYAAKLATLRRQDAGILRIH
ncbi:tetratricopeptide repeat protein [uncultured Massilia sp.]|uniref:tetratricopeptide repeat protein n=1 Tax=uncultured Massilia sp. TaxID=169973 RepID=UPI0025DEA1AE|nr:tetratricopeptide repeat protein [uncultured Massilia sp.]